MKKKPFLWNYVTSVKQSPKSSGAEERITMSANEENNDKIIQILNE